MKPRTLTVEEARRIWTYDAKNRVLRWKVKMNNREIVDQAGTFVWNRYLIRYKYQTYEMGEIVWLLNTGSLPDSKLHYIDGDGMNWDFNNLTTQSRIDAERKKPNPGPIAAIFPNCSIRLSDYQIQSIRERYALSPDSPTGIVWKVRPREHFATDNAWTAFNGRYAGKPAGVPHHLYGGRITHCADAKKRKYRVEHLIPFLKTD